MRGFYKGFAASLCVYAPSSAIWWGSYQHFREGLTGLASRRGLITSEQVRAHLVHSLRCKGGVLRGQCACVTPVWGAGGVNTSARSGCGGYRGDCGHCGDQSYGRGTHSAAGSAPNSLSVVYSLSLRLDRAEGLESATPLAG